jgi:hypothetical protein
MIVTMHDGRIFPTSSYPRDVKSLASSTVLRCLWAKALGRMDPTLRFRSLLFSLRR